MVKSRKEYADKMGCELVQTTNIEVKYECIFNLLFAIASMEKSWILGKTNFYLQRNLKAKH